jgi:hypothetical protein
MKVICEMSCHFEDVPGRFSRFDRLVYLSSDRLLTFSKLFRARAVAVAVAVNGEYGVRFCSGGIVPQVDLAIMPCRVRNICWGELG